MQPVTAPSDRSKVETGHTRGSLAHAAAMHCLKAPFTVIAAKGQEIERIAAELELWAQALEKPLKVIALPTLPHIEEEDEDDALMLQKEEKNMELLGALGEIKSTRGTPITIIGDLDAITQPLPGALASHTLKLGEKISLDALKRLLADDLGYHHEAMCVGPGQFALRGGIVDIYPPNAEAPVRLDFFGEAIEEIKQFDPSTQRSEIKLKEVTLSSAKTDGSWKSGGLLSYLPKSVQWIVIEPSELEATHPEHFSTPEKIKVPAGHFSNFTKRGSDHWIGLQRINTESVFFAGAPLTEVKTETPAKYRPIPPAGLVGQERTHAEREMLEMFVKRVGAFNKGATPIDPNNTNALQTFAFARAEVSKDFQKVLKPLNPKLIHGAIAEGFILHGADRITLALAPGDLPPYASVYTISRNSRRVARRSAVNELLDFSQVAEGDYLVHLEHGICRYRGIGKMDDGEEVLSLEFDEGVTMHLRFGESHLISRYVGLSKKTPRLNRLGSQGWAKAKKNAQAATMDYAAELLRLQAVRQSQPGFAFAPDSDLTRQFDATFPFKLTPDQATAIQATKENMMSPKPMDRLVCGDVGFGKTEVAIRAAMKAVESGKQVCVLCPTTILSQQHYNTFNERAAGFGVAVECLNRFRSHGEQGAILKGLAAGKIDIVVGTHRLLSHDIVFKDLGLIIIDEEHRFGVEQKETLKRLRTSVDVLAMSATPIPRTLQMSLGGARDLSIIETAPLNRRPIETLVKTFDEKILREAIDYETSRGGQVFYLHNRVRTITRVAMRLQEMFPKLRIAIGHGRMHAEELEEIMTDFVAGRYDILVCTTIIESGLDIPNCNTLIIEGADQFGLAQLYQIRGRVGRFNRQAYAYLFLHKNKDVASDAKSRLEALRVHNDLGAGFRIAMRDLELRGSGNLLGPQQSGHVAGVGFELYCELLKESVARLKGSAGGKVFVPRTTARLDFNFDTRIPPNYLPEARLRLELNRELSICESAEELVELAESITDRFGAPPQSVKNLLQLTELRVLAHERGIVSLSLEGERLLLMKPDGSYVKQGSLFPRIAGETPAQKIWSITALVKNLVKA